MKNVPTAWEGVVQMPVMGVGVENKNEGKRKQVDT